MRRVTPLRLIAVSLVLAVIGGLAELLTFSLSPSVAPWFFWGGNGFQALAAASGFLGFMSLAVQIGVRAASGYDKIPANPRRADGDLVERGGQVTA